MDEITAEGERVVVEAEQDRADREQCNLHTGLFKLPAELRNKIYAMIVPCGSWLTFYARFKEQDIAALQICRAVRVDVIPMFYGDNSFAIDMRSASNAALAWQWLDSLSAEAVASIRKLRLTTIVDCSCEKPFKVREGVRPYQELATEQLINEYAIKAQPDRGILGLTVTVAREVLDEPYGVSVDVCGLCGVRPLDVAAAVKRTMERMDLEDDEAVIERQDLVNLFCLVQSVSPYEAEDAQDKDDEGEQ